MSQQESSLNRAASLAGVYTAEAVAEKLSALSEDDKNFIEELLNAEGLISLSDMIGTKEYFQIFDEEGRKELSSLVGDMRMCTNDQDRKGVAKKIVDHIGE